MTTQQQHEAKILRAIEARGLRLERVGRAVRITGPGVRIVAADLSFVQPRDLKPVKADDGA